MTDTNMLNQAQDYIYKKARLLDRRRFKYHFAGGSKETVITSAARLSK